MHEIEISKRNNVTAVRSLGCWLVVSAGVAAVVGFGVQISEDPEAHPAAQDQPFAQIISDDFGARVWSLAFAPDGYSLAAATITGEVWLKDLRMGRAACILSGPIDSTRSLGFTPDGRVLAVAGGEHSLRLWDVAAGAELDRLEVGGVQSREAAFSPDGTLLAVGVGREPDEPSFVALYDWKTRRRLAALGDYPGVINALAFSPDGALLAVGDSSGFVTLWDVAGRRERVRLQITDRVGGLALAFAPDGRLLATAGDLETAAQLWDVARGEPRGSLPVSAEGVAGFAFSPDGALLALGLGDGTVTLRSRAQGRESGALQVPGGRLRSMVISRDGRLLATGGGDGALRVWDLARALAGK